MPHGSKYPKGANRPPSLRGLLQVDAVRGSPRIRAWPKPRGQHRNQTNVYWTKWLIAATYLYRYQPASIQFALQEATKGTVWMPRDLFISALRGRAYLIRDENGRIYYPMAMRQDVSTSLDAITQIPGSMIYRGADLWIPVSPGTNGQYLRYTSADQAPEWAEVPASGYTVITLLRGGISNTVYPVNNSSYSFNARWSFYTDLDTFPFTHYCINIGGRSSENSQSIKCVVAKPASPGTPIGGSGDNLSVDRTNQLYSSGWIQRTDTSTGFTEFALCVKGTNGTVDLDAAWMEILLRQV